MSQLQVNDNVTEAYEDVRNDKTETNWAYFAYSSPNEVECTQRGNGDLNELKEHFQDNERAYAYLRIVTGDEESKRAKFVFISWCGPDVKALLKAKQSVEKAEVKKVVQNFSVEIHYTEQTEINCDRLTEQVIKSGGANYGTGGSRN